MSDEEGLDSVLVHFHLNMRSNLLTFVILPHMAVITSILLEMEHRVSRLDHYALSNRYIV